MTESSLPPSPSDDAPIDAEFEPATRDESTASRQSTGPGWAAFGGLSLLTLSALGLAAATAGYVPGFQPGSQAIAAVQSELASVQTGLNEDETKTETLNTEIAALQSRADSLSADRTRASSDLRNVRTEIETLQADISVLQRARVASLADGNTSSGDGNLSPDLAALSARVTSIEDALVTQLGTYETALENLKTRLSSLESQAASDGLNAANATNVKTEAALALSAIEAAARRGRPFLSAQQKLAAALPGNEAVTRLAPLASQAVPTLSDLRASFPGLVKTALDTSSRAEGRSSNWFRGVFGDGIQVRKQGEVTSGDHLRRAETALQAGELAESIEHIRAAGPEIQPVFTDWMDNAGNRHMLEQTLEALRLTMIAEERP